MRLLIALLLLAIPATALAGHDGNAKPVRANLDGDPQLERLSVRHVRGQEGMHRPVLRDDCDAHPVSWRLSPAHERVAVLGVRELDGRSARPEIHTESRSGIAGGAGVARVFRYLRSGSGCSSPKRVFAYSTGKPKPELQDDLWVTNFAVNIGNYRARTRALEISVYESLAYTDQPAAAATGGRTTHWRIKKGRYRPYRSELVLPERRP